MRRIIETTDKRFIGTVFDDTKPIILDGFDFVPTKKLDLGGGLIRYSNINYVILTEME